VVINDFNIKRIAVGKAKTQSPLLVDANAPVALPIAAQTFQAVRRRQAQVFYANGCIQLCSRIAARRKISDGKRRDLPVAKKRSVSVSAKLRITGINVNILFIFVN
jgi:hypothetical protein